MVANRTREIRLSGMKRGACGNVSYGGTYEPAAHTERVRVGNSLPVSCARRNSISTRSSRYNKPVIYLIMDVPDFRARPVRLALA